jgi:hypothetical protein
VDEFDSEFDPEVYLCEECVHEVAEFGLPCLHMLVHACRAKSDPNFILKFSENHHASYVSGVSAMVRFMELKGFITTFEYAPGEFVLLPNMYKCCWDESENYFCWCGHR